MAPTKNWLATNQARLHGRRGCAASGKHCFNWLSVALLLAFFCSEVLTGFLGARKRTIHLINTGVITILNRGPKRLKIEDDILSSRQRAVKVFTEQSIKCKTMKDAMPVEDYIALHNKDPRDAKEVVELHFHLGQWKECVMYNVQKHNMFLHGQRPRIN